LAKAYLENIQNFKKFYLELEVNIRNI